MLPRLKVAKLLSIIFYHFIEAMSNYWMLSVGVATSDYKINLVTPNKNCPSSSITSIANISTSVFPSSMNRLMHHSLSYAADTSTLVACGGSQVTQIKISFFYWFRLLGVMPKMTKKPCWFGKPLNKGCSVYKVCRQVVFQPNRSSEFSSSYVE